MTRRGSLRVRLTAVAVLATGAVIVVVVVAFNLLLARTLDRQVDDRLRTQAAAVATTVRITGGPRGACASRPATARSTGRCGSSPGGARCSGPSAPPRVQRAAERLAARGHGMAQVGDHEARLYALPLVRGGRRRGVVVTGCVARAERPHDRPRARRHRGPRAAAAGRGGRRDVADDRSRAAPGRRDDALGGGVERARPGRRFGAEPRPDELGSWPGPSTPCWTASRPQPAPRAAALGRALARAAHARSRASSARSSCSSAASGRRRSARERARRDRAQRRADAPDPRDADGRRAGRGGAAARAAAASARRWPTRPPARSGTLGRRGVRLEVAPGRRASRWASTPRWSSASSRRCSTTPALRPRGRAHRRRSVRRPRARARCADDGRGMPAEDTERVFEPGVRGAPRDGHGGAGLGPAARAPPRPRGRRRRPRRAAGRRGRDLRRRPARVGAQGDPQALPRRRPAPSHSDGRDRRRHARMAGRAHDDDRDEQPQGGARRTSPG